MCVLETTAQSIRENGVRAELSLSFLSLTVYDVTKKAWYGRNMLDCTETSKKNVRYCGRDYYIEVIEL